MVPNDPDARPEPLHPPVDREEMRVPNDPDARPEPPNEEGGSVPSEGVGSVPKEGASRPEPPASPKGAALVTGASAGIGEALVRALARRGWDVVLVARRRERLEELAAELEAAHGVRAPAVPADLAAEDGPRLVASAVERLGLQVSFLANNAGLGQFGPYMELEAGRERDQLMVNVVALTRLTRLLLPGMVQRGEGRVLNVASVAAFFPGPLMTVYYATKAYVLSYSVGLADELRGTGVTVTCLAPGPTESEFHDRAGLQDSKLFERHVVWSPEDVAEAGVEAALKGEAVHVTGWLNKLNVNGSRLLPRPWLARIVRGIQGRR